MTLFKNSCPSVPRYFRNSKLQNRKQLLSGSGNSSHFLALSSFFFFLLFFLIEKKDNEDGGWEELMGERIDVRFSKWMSEWMDEGMIQYMNESNECISIQMNEGMNELVNGRFVGWISYKFPFPHFFVFVHFLFITTITTFLDRIFFRIILASIVYE